MIGRSLGEYLVIRTWIFLIPNTIVIFPAAFAATALFAGRSRLGLAATTTLGALTIAEAAFALLVYLPYTARLRQPSQHPPPLSRPERRALFRRCVGPGAIPRPDHYLRMWFLGADSAEIRRDNVREFLLWAFFERGDDGVARLGDEEEQDLDFFISELESLLGRSFEPGRGTAKSLRLTFDHIDARYRSVLWYGVVFLVDLLTHFALWRKGFQYYALPRKRFFSVFPPRPQQLTASRRSPSGQISYWYRPHTAKDKLPVVFLHGIGIGYLTYVDFLAEISSGDGDGDIGVLAIENLSISFRLTDPPLGREAFLQEMERILDRHGFDRFVLVSHSYGSVPTTHMVRSLRLQGRIASVVLVDPVTILLHLPDVCYNFTRRQPRMANEWQLWYFASTDPGVAHCLGRHFFWRENIVWKEELLGLRDSETEGWVGHPWRSVLVTLSSLDLIVDTATVLRYLDEEPGSNPGVDPGYGIGSESGRGAECDRPGERVTPGLRWNLFAHLDHAQVFDSPRDREAVVGGIVRRCTT